MSLVLLHTILSCFFLLLRPQILVLLSVDSELNVEQPRLLSSDQSAEGWEGSDHRGHRSGGNLPGKTILKDSRPNR